MKSINTKIGCRKAYIEHFNSYQEYLKVVEERDATNSHLKSNTLCEVAANSSFTMVSSKDEAHKLFVEGWDEPVKKLNEKVNNEVKKLYSDTPQVKKLFNDVCGFMPIVPNAIIGLPQSMLNTKVDVKKTKIIKFLIDIGYSGSVTTDEIVNYYSKLLAKVAVLEKKGYRCRLEAMACNSTYLNYLTIVCHTVLLKDERQPLDIKKLCFPIAHPAMLRVYDFAWENSLPLKYDSYHNSGMGLPLYLWKDKKIVDNLINEVSECNEKVVYVHYNMDLNSI